jgi:hypothetical protein
MQDCKDRGHEKASMDLSGMIVPWVPCPTCHGNNCDGATVKYDAIEWGEYCKDCGGLHGCNLDPASRSLKKAFGIMLILGEQFHGQEVDALRRSSSLPLGYET